VSTAFAVVANVWFVILWTRASEHEPGTAALRDAPLWLALLGGAATALGLFAFGTSLNDILDVRRDRALRPSRPLASGRIRVESAVSLVAGTLILAILGATVFGTKGVVLTLIVAAAILLFNAAGKFIPGIGVLLLGLVYAGHMMVPNVHLKFVWPVWLVLTQALAVAGVMHMVARKIPPLSRRAVFFAIVGWIFWSGLLIERGRDKTAGLEGLWPDWVSPVSGIGVAVLVVLLVTYSWRKVATLGAGQRAADKVGRYSALWMALYSCVWLLGQGEWLETAIIAGLATLGLIGMSIIREAYGLVEQPVGYRR
jgi:hypothetical protein